MRLRESAAERLVAAAVVLAAVGCAHAPPAPELATIPGPWTAETISVEGRGDEGAPVSFFYRAAGPEDARLVVLLHGFPDFSYTWREVLPALATDHRVIAPDTRGTGLTDRPEAGYRVEELGADVVALVDALLAAHGRPAGEKVHLVGHDWGAVMGWAAVSLAPERFETWTALSVPHPAVIADALANDPVQRKASSYMKLLRSAGAAGAFEGLSAKRRAGLYRGNLFRAEGFTDQDLEWYQLAFGRRGAADRPLEYYRRNDFAVLPPTSTKIEVPTLVLWGEDDEFVLSPMAPRSCEWVTERCETEVFLETGHFPHWDRPGDVVARWRRFAAPAE